MFSLLIKALPKTGFHVNAATHVLTGKQYVRTTCIVTRIDEDHLVMQMASATRLSREPAPKVFNALPDTITLKIINTLELFKAFISRNKARTLILCSENWETTNKLTSHMINTVTHRKTQGFQ